MSSLPSDPDDPVRRLLAAGYDLVLQHGHLLVRRIPYLAPEGLRRDGILALPINDSSGAITDVIGDHTIWFAGAEPRDNRGTALGGVNRRDVGGGQNVDYMLSFKPPGGSYDNLYDKVRSYSRILTFAAQSVDP